MIVSEPNHRLRLLREASRRLIPFEVSLEITHHCNFRCEHCYIPDFSAPDRLSTERIFELLDELQEMGTMVLSLTGGELFLRHDWLDIARRARKLGFDLVLLSNASLIDEKVADDIRALYAKMQISLYSLNESTFETITRRPGSFEKTLRGIKLLRDRDVRVHLNCPMMVYNFTDYQQVGRFAERIGASFGASPTITAKKNGDLAPLELRIDHGRLETYYGGPSSGCAVDQPTGEIDNAPLCAAGHRYVSIAASGDVMACNILPGTAGNILESSFREIWEGSPWLEFVRGIRRPDLRECSACERFSYCGRCNAQALVEDGDILGPSSFAQARADTLDKIAIGGLEAEPRGSAM